MNTDFKYLKVLIVEDDEHIANMIKVILMAFSVEQVHVAASYQEAIDIIEDHPVDCAIVDYLMEPDKGTRFIEHVRWSSNPDRAQMPLILCTVYTDMKTIVEARDAGVSEILAKPVTPMSIFYKIIAAMEKPRPFISAPRYKGPDRRCRTLPWKGKPERRISHLAAATKVENFLRSQEKIDV
tara:strand:- start:379 stop:924 length:546 start_codon:yes stop_codon:yes gene_type:complete